MIELDLLGPPRVRIDGSDPPPELLWRKHLALLVYLARSSRARTRDHLVGLLWPDKEESRARHSLNEALRVIRKAVGDALATEGDNVVIKSTAFRLDLDTIEDGSDAGVFLEGFSVPDAPAFENWMSTEREGLKVEILSRLVGSAQVSLAEGRLSHGRLSVEKALEIEPLHEPAAQVLMRAHALGGARSLALQAYERFKQKIECDLEMKPSEATEDLAERIRSERLVPGTPVKIEVAEKVVPVVGNGSLALASSVDLWCSSLSGHPAMIVLRGDPGTGKTRVADEVAARARLDGAVVAFARAFDHESVDGIWSAFLKGGLVVPELGGAAPQALAALGSIEPDLFAEFPAAREYNPTSYAGEPFSQAVAAVAESRPVLLVLDDAFKADRKVLDALGSIVQRAGECRVCVLLTVSAVPSEPVDTLCQRLGRDIPGQLIEIGNFDQSDVEELVDWAFPSYEVTASERLTRRVIADTAGNPFLTVEFIRAVQSGLRVRDEAPHNSWPEKARTLDHTNPGELPPTVVASLRIRFRGLSERAQTLLAVVAILGGTEPVELLARAGNISVSEAEHALDELEWQRWLVADARGYGFVTGLAKEVVLADMITGGKKRRILSRVGRE